MDRLSNNCRGMVSALFAGVVLPVLFLMFTVTVEFSQFFGIREEIQQVLDRQAHDATRFGGLVEDIEASLRRQLGNVGDVISLTDVAVQRSARQTRVSAQVAYNGMLLPIVEAFFGVSQNLLSMTVESQVQIQSAAALLVLDRSVLVGQDTCSTQGLSARETFIDALFEQWADVTTGGTSVAVFPGNIEPVELLAQDGSDGVERCGLRNTNRVFDVQSIAGTSSTFFDAYDVAFSARDVVAESIVSAAVQRRVVVLMLSRERYRAGYGAAIANVMQQATNGALFPIDLVTMVVDDSGEIQYRPSGVGINGGLYREIGASESELQSDLLVSTVAQLVRGNVVLEQ